MSTSAVAEIRAESGEQHLVRQVRALLGGSPGNVVVSVGSQQLALPNSLVEALLATAASFDAGDTVAIVSENAEVTPAEAAKLLGVSRQYVDRLVDGGLLPVRRLPNSNYRRIAVRDVLRNKATRDRKHAAITSIVDDALASGLTY